MKLIGLMPARNEEWIVGLSARVALMWCDELIVLDHASTDRTGEILMEVAQEHPDRVTVLNEADSVWQEMAHRQRILEEARRRGATHVALVDADEVLTGNLLESVREVVGALWPGQYVQTRMLCMWRGVAKYRQDASVWSNRRDFVLAFADAPSLRWSAINGYDHHQRAPLASRPGPRWIPNGGVMHLQFASWRRLGAKHALYKLIERSRWPRKSVEEIDRLYNQALDESGIAFAEVPGSWWEPYRHLLPNLNLNHEPWQEAECRRLYSERPEYFKGLNLFGVTQ